MSSYPKWLYHPTKAPTVVADEAAHRALGAGWAESPVEAKQAVVPAAREPETLGDLAEELGAKAGLKTTKKVK